jgi:ADP-heptose:LPS heptosyltransferase
VVTRGNPDHPKDATRSLWGQDAERLLTLGRDLAPPATGARDFYETAQIVAGLDLVVTVDTSVAHLAGAMGKECWVLLPRLAMDWRWNDGERSDWYPKMRLWRQPPEGGWGSVLDEVETALARGDA